MAQVISIPDMPAATDLMALLKLIQNPVVFEDRLKQMESMRQQVNAMVELVGPASDILTLRGQAAADREAAAQLRNEADEESKRIVEEAKQYKASVDKACKTKKADLERREESLRQSEENLQSEVQAHKQYVEFQNDKLASLLAEAEKAKSESEAAKALYEGKIAALNAAMKAA